MNPPTYNLQFYRWQIILMYINEHEGNIQTEVALDTNTTFDCSKKIINALESRGLARKARDGRCIRVYLTKQGRLFSDYLKEIDVWLANSKMKKTTNIRTLND